MDETGVPIWTHPRLSAIPGLFHGMSRRGISLGLGPAGSPDTAVLVRERRSRFLASLGRDAAGLLVPEQVHGSRVARADRRGEWFAATDGLVTDRDDLTLGVVTADCVPIWLVDVGKRVAALLHAGKKGTTAGIAGAGVACLAAGWGSAPAGLLAVLGPSIGPCCYDLDLWAENERQLRAAGVDRVEAARVCTGCDLATWYSYRKEKGQTGRMLSLVGWD